MLQLISGILLADLFGIGQMSTTVIFGIKIVALVMLYGYMHMNLGGGILSTAVFLVFGYYFLFYANGILALIVLALFFLMIHSFDIIWGGDIVKGGLAGMEQHKMAMNEMTMQRMMRPPP